MALFVTPPWQPVGVDMARCCAENSPAACETTYMALPFNMFPQAMPAAMPIPFTASSFPFPAFFPTFLPIAGVMPAMFYHTASEIGASTSLQQAGEDQCVLDPPSESSASTGAPEPQQQRTSHVHGGPGSNKPSRMALYRSGDSASRTSLGSCCGAGPSAHPVVSSACTGNSRLSEIDLDPGSVWPSLQCPSELCDTDTEGLLATDGAMKAVPQAIPVAGPLCSSGAAVPMQVCPWQSLGASLAPVVRPNLPARVTPRGNNNLKTQHAWEISKLCSPPEGKAKACAVLDRLLKEKRQSSGHGGDDVRYNHDDGFLRVDGLNDGGMPSRDGWQGGAVAEPLCRVEPRGCGRVLLRGATGALVWVDTRRHRAIIRRQHRRQRLMHSGQLLVTSSPCNRKPPGSVSRHGLALLCGNSRAMAQLPERRLGCSHDDDVLCCNGNGNCNWCNGPKLDADENAGKGGSYGLHNAAGTTVQAQLNAPAQTGYIRCLDAQLSATPRAAALNEYHTAYAVEESAAAALAAVAPTVALMPSATAGPATAVFVLPPAAAAAAVLTSPWSSIAEERVELARTALEAELQAVLAEETGILDVSEDSSDGAGCSDAGNECAGDPIVPASSSAAAPAAVP
ncbi:hypothetical protein Vretimale_18276 [Volvox reticuliferus]|nr:hypothetical protein Vretifemale_18047 [Volvox reticuliferus]GIM15492.1 hypothetical protein Vretimale_18276 [Volvox reticuliferus]